MKQILQNLSNGQTELAEVPCPQAKSGQLLIRTRASLVSAGEVVDLQKFHELSFPYIYYLRKLLKLDIFAKFVLPFVGLFLFVFPEKNKMLIIARKR
jgi:hypothetical protein